MVDLVSRVSDQEQNCKTGMGRNGQKMAYISPELTPHPDTPPTAQRRSSAQKNRPYFVVLRCGYRTSSTVCRPAARRRAVVVGASELPPFETPPSVPSAIMPSVDFRSYISSLFVCLLNFLPPFLPSLLSSLHMLSSLLICFLTCLLPDLSATPSRIDRFHSRLEFVGGYQTSLQFFWFILCYSVFCYVCMFLLCLFQFFSTKPRDWRGRTSLM